MTAEEKLKKAKTLTKEVIAEIKEKHNPNEYFYKKHLGNQDADKIIDKSLNRAFDKLEILVKL